ncbi:MAG: indolepyruvate oxidoreductase subunit beta [Desulfobacula sp.]|jgi:indolepyruvate ferredoxin oxidoreductase beta subunit|nr:indolepyruvate oxidoreductase subunit beta [Desulfobacula sp.]
MNLQNDPLNLIICGIGGQGNIRVSRMIGKILNDKGFYVNIGETFGAAQRGGAVFSCMRVSKEKDYGPLIPKGRAHMILSLEPLEALRILGMYGNPQVATIVNTQSVLPVGVLAGEFDYPNLNSLQKAIQGLSGKYWAFNATKMAMALESPIVTNIVMLGALARTQIIPVDLEDVQTEIKKSFPPSVVEVNLQALKMGSDAVEV